MECLCARGLLSLDLPADEAELARRAPNEPVDSPMTACEEKHVGSGVLLFADTDLGRFPPDLMQASEPIAFRRWT
jgi:hypothetical protein